MRSLVIQLVTAACLVITVTTGVQAQQQDKLLKLDREIGLVENVIKVILSDESFDNYYSPHRITGSYLENYGAVFLVSLSTRNFRGEKTARARGGYEEIKERLRRVFPDYISRVKQLNPNDRITFVVYPTDRSTTRWTGRKTSKSAVSEEFRPYAFLLTAKRSEILTGPPDRAIKFIRADKGGYTTSNAREDIRIMKAIFARAMREDFQTSLSSSSVQAAYIKDFGMLFTLNAGSDYFTSGPRVTLVADAKLISETRESGERSLQIAIDRPGRFFSEAEKLAVRQAQEQSINERTGMLFSRITELIGAYGGTISGLEQDDRITIHLSAAGDRRDFFEGINIQISMLCKDIRAYQRGRIDFRTFSGKAEITRIQ